jgi:hypothetical protein
VGGGVGYLSTGTVNNVKVTTSTITGLSYVGGVVGSSGANTTVSNCSTDNATKVTSTYKAKDDTEAEKLKQGAGGIIGASRATLTNNTSAAKVNAVQYAGGIVGVNYTAIASKNVASGNITSSGNEAGGIAGLTHANISKCQYTGGTVEAYEYAGGIVAMLTNLSLNECQVSGKATVKASHSATGNVYTGGLVGAMYGSKIEKCDITGDNVAVNAGPNGSGNTVGGVVGALNSGSSITNGSFTVSVRGNNLVGGIAGNAGESTISGVNFVGEVIGNNNIGGIAGTNSGTITNVHSTANVSGKDYFVGGIVGNNKSGLTALATITNSSSGGNVVSQGNGVGGIAGYSNGKIEACKASGKLIKGAANVGGLVGTLEYSNGMVAFLTDSYYLNLTGRIESTAGNKGYVGGLVGALGNPGTNTKNEVLIQLAGSFTWVKEVVPARAKVGYAGLVVGYLEQNMFVNRNGLEGGTVFYPPRSRMEAFGTKDGTYPYTTITAKDFKNERFGVQGPKAATADNSNNWKNFGNGSVYNNDNPPIDCFPKLKWE